MIPGVVMRAPLPVNEQDRVRALHGLNILDAPPEPDLVDIVRLAAGVCGTPQSMVSLVDTDRQRITVRLDDGPSETPREESFCAHAILGRGLFVVPDARADERFADNPHVLAEPGVRFYAGAPLVTVGGHALGTLCVTDAVPRRLNLGQLRALRALARQVTTQLDLRHHAAVATRDAVRRHEVDQLTGELAPLARLRLRQPLAELLRCAELLRDVDFCPPELAARVGAAMHAQAPDLIRLLDNLVRIAGPADPEPALARRQLDLNSLVDWAVREVRPIADAKDIRMRFDAGPPAPVVVDPRLLAVSVAHLLFTAVKFTPCAGRVRIRVGGGAGQPTVELHDVGVGDEPAHLFEHVLHGALLRGPNPGATADAGLAAVRAILDAHHVNVAMSDDAAEGTALHLVFPAAS